MALKKKQHFVPQFYMRNFSPDGKSFSLYMIKEKRVISRSSFANQCYDEYYYGEDLEWENTLARMESRWSICIKKAIQNENLNNDEINDLKEFIVYQLIRTRGQNQHITKESLADVLHTTCRRLGILAYRDHPDVMKEAAKVAENLNRPEKWLSYIKSRARIVDDLSILIVNYDTPNALISSDNPVIIFNSFVNDALHLSYMGIVMVCPISPSRLLVLYDSKLYPRFASERQIRSRNNDEVIKLNNLQFQNAERIAFAIKESDFSSFSKSDYEHSLEKKAEYSKLVSAGMRGAALCRGNLNDYSFSFARLKEAFKQVPVICRVGLLRANVVSNYMEVMQQRRTFFHTKEGKDILANAGIDIKVAKRGVDKMISCAKKYWRASIPSWVDMFEKAPENGENGH